MLKLPEFCLRVRNIWSLYYSSTYLADLSKEREEKVTREIKGGQRGGIEMEK
jgi:hypothetical protein